jgi:hypothetical protein
MGDAADRVHEDLTRLLNFLQDYPLDNAGADTERPADLEDAIALCPQFFP